MEKEEKHSSVKEQEKIKVKDFHFEDVIFEDSEGEYRYNYDSDKYEYYPDWLGNNQSETEFWETR